MFKLKTMTHKYFVSEMFIILILFSFGQASLLSAESVHVDGTFDLDHDGKSELILFNQLSDSPVKFVEIDSSGKHQEMWNFSIPASLSGLVSDVTIDDLDGDDIPEMIICFLTFNLTDGTDYPWLFIYRWNGMNFSDRPIVAYESNIGKERIRPVQFSLFRYDEKQYMSLVLGAPDRETLILEVDLKGFSLNLNVHQQLKTKSIHSGFGNIYSVPFQKDEKINLAIINPEPGNLKVNIYDVSDKYLLVSEEILPLAPGVSILGHDFFLLDENNDNTEEIYLPATNGSVAVLNWINDELSLADSRFSNKYLFNIEDSNSDTVINQTILLRVEEGIYEKLPVTEPEAPVVESIPDSLETLPIDSTLQFEPEFIIEEGMVFYPDTLALGDTLILNLKEDNQGTFYRFQWEQSPPEGSIFDPEETQIIWIPRQPQTGHNRFRFQLTLKSGEKLEKTKDEIGERLQIVPILEKMENDWIVVVLDTIKPPIEEPPVVEETKSERKIEIYSIMVMTPYEDRNSRYLFDGVAPFNITVNEIPTGTEYPPMGHRISANLVSIKEDKSVSFSYKKPIEDTLSTTTITMIHDLESNLLYLSLEPAQDTIPKAYHPASSDSSLNQFPEYYFEGFPQNIYPKNNGSLLQFPFMEDLQDTSFFPTIALHSPTSPEHQLTLFVDGGHLLRIEGEVRVKENGSKKTVTRIEFSGEPTPVMIHARLLGYLPKSDIPRYNLPDEMEKDGEPQEAPIDSSLFVPDTSVKIMEK